MTGFELKFKHFFGWSIDLHFTPSSQLNSYLLALPLLLLANSRFGWYMQKVLQYSSQISALGTQSLRLDDCVPDSLGFVLIYTIIVGPLSLMNLIKGY